MSLLSETGKIGYLNRAIGMNIQFSLQMQENFHIKIIGIIFMMAFVNMKCSITKSAQWQLR